MRLALLPLFALPILCFGQNSNHDVIAVQGGFSTGQDMSISWTLGEAFVETVSGIDGLITEGFQQPELTIRTVARSVNMPASVYPNPTTSSVTIQLAQEELCRIRFIDAAGRILYDKKVRLTTQEIDVSEFSQGTYFVILNGLETSNQAHFSIIKH